LSARAGLEMLMPGLAPGIGFSPGEAVETDRASV
jgi:hypothetical protein